MSTIYMVQNTQITEDVLKIAKALELLSAGKRIKVDMNYVYESIPIIKVVGTDGSSDMFDLPCISERKFDTYLVEKDIKNLDEVKVVGYSEGKCKKIKYVYCNPQMNRMFACLEDGTEVDWKFNIIDVCHSFQGEYKDEE